MKRVDQYNKTDLALIHSFVQINDNEWSKLVNEKHEKNMSKTEVYNLIYNKSNGDELFTIIENKTE